MGRERLQTHYWINIIMRDSGKLQILAIDDVPENLNVLRASLTKAGYHFLAAPSGEVALMVAKHSHPDLILLDVVMPDMDGYEVCKRLKADSDLAEIPVIFLTGRSDTESVIEGFDVGGIDYIVKPFHEKEVRTRVATHIKISRLTRDLQQRTAELQREIEERRSLSQERELFIDRIATMEEREAQRWGVDAFVGHSQATQRILKSVAMVQNADMTRVLITGESGTGKELIARAIHSGSGRAAKPFVTVNCAAMPDTLADSMLFGHRKGAFTGADRNHRGYFEQAHGGTLFLDEIGDMPPLVQAKILRALEDGYVQPLGGYENRPVDVRVLAATNVDLRSAVEQGHFRNDLYYRLAQYMVEIPPLRARREDIVPLAEYFLHMCATDMGIEPPALATECRARLEGHSFPGNVRELKNVMERSLIESEGGRIEPNHLHFVSEPAAPSPSPGGDAVPQDYDEAIQFLVERALARNGGNVTAAAEWLGIHRSRFYRLMARK